MNKQKGYSLIELSIVIIILAIIFSLLYKYYPRTKNVEQQVVVPLFDTENIDNAIVGFAYSHGRLPFPDSNGSGVENVGAVRGVIPYITLGLAEKPVNEFNIPLVYSIFRKENVADPTMDSDLATNKDRLYALLPAGTRVAALTPLNQTNTIDFCFALKLAANITTYDNMSLYVSKLETPVYNKNIAYVLVDPGATDADGDGNLLDGLNTAGINFEVATKAKSITYDDQVNSKEFSEIFGAMGCGAVISAALHSHDNAVLAADMMHTSFQDYSKLLQLSKDLADAGNLLADAAILQAVAGIADVAAAAANAAAETLITPFEAKGAAAIAVLVGSAVVSGAATVAAALGKTTAEDAVQKVKDAQNCFDSGTGPICTGGQTGLFVSKLAALTVTIRNNAIAADAAGL